MILNHSQHWQKLKSYVRYLWTKTNMKNSESINKTKIIIIIIRSHRQQRSIASTQSGHIDEPWTIWHECWRVYHCRSAGSMNVTGILAVAANQDQSGGQFLLLQPVIMRGMLACGHWVSAHGRTMNFVSWRWYPEHGRLVRSTTSVFLTKSCQRIPRIIRWEHMWKTSSFRRSSCRSVHVCELYNKMDIIIISV